TPLLNDAARQLFAQQNDAATELGAKLTASFQLAAVEPEIVRLLKAERASHPAGTGGTAVLLRALRELKSTEVELLAGFARESGNPDAQYEAVAALAASRDPRGPQQLASLYPSLPAVSRRAALASLTSTKP